MSSRKLIGKVLSNKMTNTVVVSVSRDISHPKYHKRFQKHSKYYAHTTDQHEIGSIVNIVQVRPLSKLKRYQVVTDQNIDHKEIEKSSVDTSPKTVKSTKSKGDKK